VTSPTSAAVAPDPEMTTVRRAFDAASRRMCEAGDEGQLADELSNMLHHLYRLGELQSHRWGLTKSAFNAKVSAVPGALGGLWIRAFDTHEVATVSELGDLISDYYTNIYGVLVWRSHAAMPFANSDKDGRYVDYDTNLQDRPVLDTLNAAFSGLEALI
jgi:hypothetical protein